MEYRRQEKLKRAYPVFLRLLESSLSNFWQHFLFQKLILFPIHQSAFPYPQFLREEATLIEAVFAIVRRGSFLAYTAVRTFHFSLFNDSKFIEYRKNFFHIYP